MKGLFVLGMYLALPLPGVSCAWAEHDVLDVTAGRGNFIEVPAGGASAAGCEHECMPTVEYVCGSGNTSGTECETSNPFKRENPPAGKCKTESSIEDYGGLVENGDSAGKRALARIAFFIEEALTESATEDGVGLGEHAMGMAMEHFEGLLRNPLPINYASAGELETLLVLSGFQIESILNYRERSGKILSAAELGLIHGFDENAVEVILPFITFGERGGIGTLVPEFSSVKEFLEVCDSRLYVKSMRNLHPDPMFAPITQDEFLKSPDSRYLGTPYYMQIKFRTGFGDKVETGFTLENDIGERLFPKGGPPVDFFSFHVSLGNMGKVKRVIAGDYNARFGQGLILWNSFSLNSIGTPSALCKKGSAFLPFTSTAESGFFRGAAASLSFGKLDLNAMFSCSRLDARIEGNCYTSIVDDGKHNTITSAEYRKSMRETVGGLNLSYMFRNLKIGVSSVVYGYDKSNGRSIKEYNRYQMYDGLWGNTSFDYYAVWGNVRLFGEMAIDFGGSGAFLAGAHFPIGGRVECGIMARAYSKSYIAPHASAYSTLSTVSNQRGAVVNVRYTPFKWLALTYFGEYVHYPWVRYNIDGPSSMVKNSLKGVVDMERCNGYVSLTHAYYSHNALNKFQIKSKFSYKLSENAGGTLHAAVVNAGKTGYEFGTDWRVKLFREVLAVSSGACYFDCMDWKGRLYIYEKDLPYTYSNRLLYGRGISLYLLVECRICRSMDLYVKNGTRCYFSDNSGSQSELKLAMKVSF